MDRYGYINGFIERNSGGNYGGALTVHGIDLSPVEATFFNKDGDMYLWLKRAPIMEYEFETQAYSLRRRKPSFEAYLKKTVGDNVVAYRGEFMFMRFKFSITGVWDSTFGMDKQRLNLFVERLPVSEQTLLKDINERKRNDK